MLNVSKTDFKLSILQKLSDTDFIAIRHAAGEDQVFGEGYTWEGWRSYRQGLRDMLDISSDWDDVLDPHTFDWPLRPTSPKIFREKLNKSPESREDLKRILVEEYGKDLSNYPNL